MASKNKKTARRNFFVNVFRSLVNTKTSTKFVVSAIFAVTIYVIAGFVVFIATDGNNISDGLTVAWFSFWTVEIVSLASIKNTKTKKGKKKPKEDNANDTL